MIDGPFLKADDDGVIELLEQNVKTFRNLIYFVRENSLLEHVSSDHYELSMLKGMASFYLIDLGLPKPSSSKILHHYRLVNLFDITRKEYDIYLDSLLLNGVGNFDHLYHLIGAWASSILLKKEFVKLGLKVLHQDSNNLIYRCSFHILTYESLMELKARYPGFDEKFNELA